VSVKNRLSPPNLSSTFISQTQRITSPYDLESSQPEAISNEKVGSERMCRICHGGEDEGKLFSPCKCKGSIKFVHVGCLDQWRKVSKNSQSFFQCENCHYKYNFRRTTISQLFKSVWMLQVVTLFVFMVLIIMAGYCWKLVEYLVAEEEERHFTSFIWVDAYHLMTGTILVGFIGFFQLFFWANFRPFGLGHAGGGRNNVEVVLIAIVVLIGCIKTLISLYGIVKDLIQRLLLQMENMILEVPQDD